MIVEQGNDYLVGVKQNQPKVLQAIQQVAATQAPGATDVQYERTRNRQTERIVSLYNDVSGIDPAWASARSLIVVQRRGTREGQAFEHTSYYLSSVSLPVAEVAQGIRGHRLIENALHWVKDVGLGEDTSRIRAITPAINGSILRNLVISLLRFHGYSSITRAQRLMGHDLEKLFALFTMN